MNRFDGITPKGKLMSSTKSVAAGQLPTIYTKRPPKLSAAQCAEAEGLLIDDIKKYLDMNCLIQTTQPQQQQQQQSQPQPQPQDGDKDQKYKTDQQQKRDAQARQEVAQEALHQKTLENSDAVETKWEQKVGAAKKLWGELTADEILQSEGDIDKLSGLIKARYLVSKLEANRQVKNFLANWI